MEGGEARDSAKKKHTMTNGEAIVLPSLSTNTQMEAILGTGDGARTKVNLNSFARPEIQSMSEHDVEPPQADHCWNQLVMTENNKLRVAWSCMLFLLLAYTATVYLYRFTFFTFHIGSDEVIPKGEQDLGWTILDKANDVIFWLDLFANFLFSFKNDRGVEIDSMHLIAARYLKCHMWVNLVACMPEQIGTLMVLIVYGGRDSVDGMDFRVARLTRLQRISRLTRLIRLTRLLKCFSYMSNSSFFLWLKTLRGLRIINFIFFLMFSVHLLACGWYLCAALHYDVGETWVARRTVNSEGVTLMGAPPWEQWIHSMYFVLTIFTTVGFGDIAPRTEFEILYVGFTMVAGTVVHSIIISEVIQAVTSTDKLQELAEKQLNLIDAYCDHTQLPWEAQAALKQELKYRARDFISAYNLDKDQMAALISGKDIPRWLLGSLPARMFGGKLLTNQFFISNLYLPPRLPCLLAVHLHQTQFDAGELVYQMHDFPFNIFLVLRGTFAHIAWPTEEGGADAACESYDPTAHSISSQIKQNKAKKVDVVTMMGEKLLRRELSLGLRPLNSHTSSEHREETSQSNLYPYRLQGHNTYFGDVEVLAGTPRVTSVRCESQFALALLLHKEDFNNLKDQFPQFGALWQYAARRREWTRLKQRSQLHRGLPFRVLAACQIQREWLSSRGRMATGVVRARKSVGMNNVHLFAQKRFINASAARGPQEGTNSNDASATNWRVDKLSDDVNCLRLELHELVRVLAARNEYMSV